MAVRVKMSAAVVMTDCATSCAKVKEEHLCLIPVPCIVLTDAFIYYLKISAHRRRRIVNASVLRVLEQKTISVFTVRDHYGSEVSLPTTCSGSMRKTHRFENLNAVNRLDESSSLVAPRSQSEIAGLAHSAWPGRNADGLPGAMTEHGPSYPIRRATRRSRAVSDRC